MAPTNITHKSLRKGPVIKSNGIKAIRADGKTIKNFSLVAVDIDIFKLVTLSKLFCIFSRNNLAINPIVRSF